MILQTLVKSFDDGSLQAATRQYDSAPSSFAFLALVTTSSGVGNWYVSIPVSKNADCPQNVQSSLHAFFLILFNCSTSTLFPL